MYEITSSEQADFITIAPRYRERDGEIFVPRHSRRHRWRYFPRMLPEHALLLKTYESESDGRARFLGHSSFEDPTTAPDAPAQDAGARRHRRR